MRKSKKEIATQVENMTVFSAMDEQALQNCIMNIDKAQLQSEGLAETIAYNLCIVNDRKLYQLEDAKSITEWATNRFNISKGTVSDAIATFKRFGSMESGRIDDKYNAYTFSSLIRLKKYSDEDLEDAAINPSMSRGQMLNALEVWKNAKEDEEKLTAIRKEWESVYEELSKLPGMDTDKRREHITSICPDYYAGGINDQTYGDLVKLVQLTKSFIVGYYTVNTDDIQEIDNNVRKWVEEMTEENATEVVTGEVEDVDEDNYPHSFPKVEIKISEYLRDNGSIDKKAILGDIWDTIQRVFNSEFDLLITK